MTRANWSPHSKHQQLDVKAWRSHRRGARGKVRKPHRLQWRRDEDETFTTLARGRVHWPPKTSSAKIIIHRVRHLPGRKFRHASERKFHQTLAGEEFVGRRRHHPPRSSSAEFIIRPGENFDKHIWRKLKVNPVKTKFVYFSPRVEVTTRMNDNHVDEPHPTEFLIQIRHTTWQQPC